MEILCKPYDRIEYEKLWEEASLQKPLEGQRVLRSDTKTYKLDSNGKSYLEREEYSGELIIMHWCSQALQMLFSSQILSRRLMIDFQIMFLFANE